MKKLLLILLTSASLSYATLVTISDKQTLTARFQEAGFNHFIEKIDIIDQLAGQQKETLGIILSVELALADYAQYIKATPIMAVMMQMRKSQIFEAILEDQPEALEEVNKQVAEIASQSNEE